MSLFTLGIIILVITAVINLIAAILEESFGSFMSACLCALVLILLIFGHDEDVSKAYSQGAIDASTGVARVDTLKTLIVVK